MSKFDVKVQSRPYAQPRLTIFGKMAELTTAGGSALGELNGNGTCSNASNKKC